MEYERDTSETGRTAGLSAEVKRPQQVLKQNVDLLSE